MNEFIPVQVYLNLVKMIGYRGVTLSTPPYNSDDLILRLNHYEFVTINGKRAAEDIRGAATVIIILIKPNSKYSNKTSEFKKLFRGLPKMKEDENLNVIFVSEYVLTIHINKMLANQKVPNVFIESYDYEKFMLEAPKHESVPEHTILSDEEVDYICNKYYTSKDKFPKIVSSDTQAVWLGLRPGMVVKIERISETAGTAPAYRFCIK